MEINTSESFRINKMRELSKRMRESPCYVEEQTKVADIRRWSERNNEHGKKKHERLLDSLAQCADSFPPELLASKF